MQPVSEAFHEERPPDEALQDTHKHQKPVSGLTTDSLKWAGPRGSSLTHPVGGGKTPGLKGPLFAPPIVPPTPPGRCSVDVYKKKILLGGLFIIVIIINNSSFSSLQFERRREPALTKKKQKKKLSCQKKSKMTCRCWTMFAYL